MSPNAFIGLAQAPSDFELSQALGGSRKLWDDLLAELSGSFGLATSDWHSYSKKAGWSLRVKKGDRNIVYLSPIEGRFMASFALGDKAMAAARASRLPKSAIAMLDAARRYAEGTAVRIDVKKGTDLAVVRKLVEAKLAH